VALQASAIQSSIDSTGRRLVLRHTWKITGYITRMVGSTGCCGHWLQPVYGVFLFIVAESSTDYYRCRHLQSCKLLSWLSRPRSSISSPQQPGFVPELRERLFGHSDEGCNIIELGAPSHPLLLLIQPVSTDSVRRGGTGTGMV